MEKGKGGLESEWFHIPPWEVPNFRASFEVGMKRALGGWRIKRRGTWSWTLSRDMGELQLGGRKLKWYL